MNTRKPFLWCLAAITLTIGLVGCQQPVMDEDAPEAGMEAGPVAGEGMEMSAEGQIRMMTAYPTGNPATSMVMIERTAPGEVQVGEAFEYQIRVTNISSGPLHQVEVSECCASNFTFDSSTPAAARQEEGRQVWTVGELASQQTYEITVKGTAGEIGAIKDCLAVTYTPQSCMTIEAVETKLELAYDGPTEAAVQETIPVSLTISNPGNRAVADVEIQFSLPEGLVTAAGNTRILGKVGTLGAGEKKIMRISLKVQEAGTYENEVTATGAGGLEAKVSFTLTVK